MYGLVIIPGIRVLDAMYTLPVSCDCPIVLSQSLLIVIPKAELILDTKGLRHSVGEIVVISQTNGREQRARPLQSSVGWRLRDDPQGDFGVLDSLNPSLYL